MAGARGSRDVERPGLSGNVLLPAASTGLLKDSVAVPLGLELIDRTHLADRSGRLPHILVDEIDVGLRSVLGCSDQSHGGFAQPTVLSQRPNRARHHAWNTEGCL